MKKELQDKLFEKYPRIFRQKELPPDQTCMCWGIDTGDGWFNLLDALCFNIQDHLDQHNGEGEFEDNKKSHEEDHEPVRQVEAVQVKEKFGGLRFYWDGGDHFIEGLVSMAESMSVLTCENCGNPGTQSGHGWIWTACDVCRGAQEERR